MQEGKWFLADEFNLANTAIMNILFPLLEGKMEIQIPGKAEKIYAKPGFRIFATQNDASYANRKVLPTLLRNRFTEVQVPRFTKQELVQILQKKFAKEFGADSLYLANAFQVLYSSINDAIDKNSVSFGDRSVQLTFREIIKWVRRFAATSEFFPNQWALPGVTLLVPRVRSGRDVVYDIVNNSFFKSRIQHHDAFPENISIEHLSGSSGFKFVAKEHELFRVPFGNLNKSRLFANNRMPPTSFIRYLYEIALCAKNNDAVLLTGDTSCKTTLVETWVAISSTEESSPLEMIHLTHGTESTDLIGQVHPTTVKEACISLCNTWQQFVERLSSVRAEGKNDRVLALSQRFYDSESALNRKMVALRVKLDDILRKKETSPGIQEQMPNGSEAFTEEKDNTQTEEDSPLEEDEVPPMEEDESPPTMDEGPHKQLEEDKAPEMEETEQLRKEMRKREISGVQSSNSDNLGEIMKLLSLEGEELHRSMLNLLNLMVELKAPDRGLQLIYDSAILLHSNILKSSVKDTLFLFRDGVITRSVKVAHPILLEDFDAPNQSVTERLNSMLETERSFFITENVTGVGKIIEIELLKRFNIFATVHTTAGQRFNLSPATRSRFTVQLKFNVHYLLVIGNQNR